MLGRRYRFFIVGGSLLAAVIHAVKTPAHFQIATWLGFLFVVDTIGFVSVALWTLASDSRVSRLAVALLAAGTAAGYIVSRTVGLPHIGRLTWDGIGVSVSVIEVVVSIFAVVSVAPGRERSDENIMRRAA
jgi:hypothetical protein